MPQLGESVTEGDTVEQYDPLFEVVTDKGNAEVPAEVAGTITKIMVPDGETVKVGTPLAEISGDGAGASPSEAPAAEEASAEAAAESPAAEAAPQEAPAPEPEQPEAQAPPEPEAPAAAEPEPVAAQAD